MCKGIAKKGTTNLMIVGDVDAAVCAHFGAQKQKHVQFRNWFYHLSGLVNSGMSFDTIVKIGDVALTSENLSEADRREITEIHEVLRFLNQEFEIIQDPRCDGDCAANQRRMIREAMEKAFKEDPLGALLTMLGEMAAVNSAPAIGGKPETKPEAEEQQDGPVPKNRIIQFGA